MNRLRWAVVVWLVPQYCDSQQWPQASKIRAVPAWRLRLAEWLKSL